MAEERSKALGAQAIQRDRNLRTWTAHRRLLSNENNAQTENYNEPKNRDCRCPLLEAVRARL